MLSMTNIDKPHAEAKTSHVDHIGVWVYNSPPTNNIEFPIAVAASQQPCINPCIFGGATFETNARPRGDMKSSATVKIKYKTIITIGVTLIAFIASTDILLNSSFDGNAKE